MCMSMCITCHVENQFIAVFSHKVKLMNALRPHKKYNKKETKIIKFT